MIGTGEMSQKIADFPLDPDGMERVWSCINLSEFRDELLRTMSSPRRALACHARTERLIVRAHLFDLPQRNSVKSATNDGIIVPRKSSKKLGHFPKALTIE
jgi:hypothetical protein